MKLLQAEAARVRDVQVGGWMKCSCCCVLLCFVMFCFVVMFCHCLVVCLLLLVVVVGDDDVHDDVLCRWQR